MSHVSPWEPVAAGRIPGEGRQSAVVPRPRPPTACGAESASCPVKAGSWSFRSVRIGGPVQNDRIPVNVVGQRERSGVGATGRRNRGAGGGRDVYDPPPVPAEPVCGPGPEGAVVHPLGTGCEVVRSGPGSRGRMENNDGAESETADRGQPKVGLRGSERKSGCDLDNYVAAAEYYIPSECWGKLRENLFRLFGGPSGAGW